jgi:hypothetical protein
LKFERHVGEFQDINSNVNMHLANFGGVLGL